MSLEVAAGTAVEHTEESEQLEKPGAGLGRLFGKMERLREKGVWTMIPILHAKAVPHDVPFGDAEEFEVTIKNKRGKRMSIRMAHYGSARSATGRFSRIGVYVPTASLRVVFPSLPYEADEQKRERVKTLTSLAILPSTEAEGGLKLKISKKLRDLLFDL